MNKYEILHSLNQSDATYDKNECYDNETTFTHFISNFSYHFQNCELYALKINEKKIVVDMI